MFRRKRATESTTAPQGAGASPATPATDGGAPAPTSGPVNAEGLDDGVERVDLGGLLIAPAEGLELRLQVDEASGAVQSVLLVGAEGAMELQAFAAPRAGDLWSRVRVDLAADVSGRGGQVVEREGRFGTELVCQVPVTQPDGKPAIQPSRIIGINGDRWLLRASLFGKPALEPESGQEFEDALIGVAVRRGTGAMPVGSPIAVRLPEQVGG